MRTGKLPCSLQNPSTHTKKVFNKFVIQPYYQAVTGAERIPLDSGKWCPMLVRSPGGYRNALTDPAPHVQYNLNGQGSMQPEPASRACPASAPDPTKALCNEGQSGRWEQESDVGTILVLSSAVPQNVLQLWKYARDTQSNGGTTGHVWLLST